MNDIEKAKEFFDKFKQYEQIALREGLITNKGDIEHPDYILNQAGIGFFIADCLTYDLFIKELMKFEFAQNTIKSENK